MFQVRRYERLGSTSDELRLLAAQGAPHGTVVQAAVQTAGRGRQGRHWMSPAGNLYISVLLRPEIPLRRLTELGFVAGLAVADAVDAALPDSVRARLKWPNDVLIEGAKVAGVLLESETVPGGGLAVLLGIGLNVEFAPAGLPYPATCLRAHGAADVAAMRDRVLAGLAGRWEEWQCGGFAGVRESWLRRGPAAGAVLRVSAPEGTITGSFAGLDTDGALLVQVASGVRRLVAGDVLAGGARPRDEPKGA